MLVIVFSLQKQEEKYSKTIAQVSFQLSKEKTLLDNLVKTTQRLRQSMKFNTQATLESEKNMLLACAKKNHLKYLDIKVFPPEIIYKDTAVRLEKISVRMNFLVTKDDYFWKFLNNLHELCPKAIIVHFLSIKRIFTKEHECLFLKCCFHFDWCNVFLTSEHP
jgi:excinuclease UvrABC nuclease subunit